MSKQERFYRAQSKCHHDCPLVPTAMRCNNILRLRTNPTYVELIKEFQDFKIEATTKWYNDIRCTKKINPFEGYFLSLVNLCLSIKQNPIFKIFYKAPFFTDTQHDIGTLDCDDTKTIERCYSYAKALFKNPEKQNAAPLYHDIIKEELSYFQHLNYVFNKTVKGCPFPTMMLDWTDSLTIAKKFVDDREMEIFSIDIKKCFEFFQSGLILKLDNSKPRQPQIDEAQKIYESGTKSGLLPDNIEPNILGLYHYKMKNCTNQLMIEQCGATIFWPWSFTSDELVEQREKGEGLGYELDFRIEPKE